MDILYFVLAIILVYGIGWLITKIFDSPATKINAISSTKYHFYNPHEAKKVADPIITKVVGVTFENRQKIIRHLFKGEMIEVIREPNNPHDTNAVKVVNKSGEQIGYLDRELAQYMTTIFSLSVLYYRPAKVLEIIGDEKKGQSLGVIIEIYPPSLEETIAKDTLIHPC